MPFGAVFGLTLIVTASIDGNAISPQGVVAPIQMSVQQKNATLQPLVGSATDCIVRKIADDPRMPELLKTGEIRELIVEWMPSCKAPVWTMIDAYDRLFGEGTGEKFFMGPYLSMLPNAVQRLLNDAAK
jgi:hypothetical protein